MTSVLADYGLTKFFSDVDESKLKISEEVSPGGARYLIVTEISGEEGGQHLFQFEAGFEAEYITSDTVIELIPFLDDVQRKSRPSGVCSSSSASDHATMHQHIVVSVNQFRTNKGPGNGNLACVWAVRKLAQQCLGREIHQSDSTSTFGSDLLACQIDDLAESDIPPGGIIISPTVTTSTKKRNIGHVGILGTGNGASRLIYSNSSSAAVWSQNFTLGSWLDHYGNKKGLKVLFFNLPHYQ